MHERQTGIAAHNDFFRRDFQQIREQGARLRNAFQPAIVARIRPAGGAVIILPRQRQ